MTQVETKPLLHSARIIRQALLLLFGGLMLGAAIVVAWLVLDTGGLGQALAAITGYEAVTLRLWQDIALGALVLVHLGIWAAIAWRGQLIFGALLAEDIPAASVAARQIARLLWVMLVWSLLSHTLAGLAITWHFPEGQRVLSLSLGTAQVSTILAALLATFTSHAFVLGAALWQDHKEVI